MRSVLSLLRTRAGSQTKVAGARCRRSRHRPMLDRLEERMLLSTADGNGPVVTGLYEQINQATGTASLVVDFDGPLNARLASNVADYQVTRVGPVDPEIVTRSGPATPIINASYSEFVERGAVVSSVALRLARPLAAGTFYRVWINGYQAVD